MLDGLTIMTDDIVLKYEYNDAEELARAYMSYVTEGGLFIQTTEEFKLGDIVHVLVNLPDDGDEIEFSGSIVWITPDKSKVMWFNSENTSDASSPSGVGVLLGGPQAPEVRTRIEKILEENPDLDQLTDTI